MSNLDFYVISVDSIGGQKYSHKLKDGWSDKPPLFEQRKDKRGIREMCRTGIPPILRCAVWYTSTIRVSHPHQSKSDTDEYGTFKKMEAIDHGWSHVLSRVFPDKSDEDSSAHPPSFGLSKESMTSLLTSIRKSSNNPGGVQSLTRVLSSIHHVLGIEYCPLLPDVTTTLLYCMPESYAYATIREMLETPGFYLPTSPVEHYAWCRTFVDILIKFYPKTGGEMEGMGATRPEGLDCFFTRFFRTILKREHVLRIMDLFTIEGSKLLFRISLALLSLHKKQMKSLSITSMSQWWDELHTYAHSSSFSIDALIQRAYTLHGSRLRRRLRFPRRRIIQRMMKLNESWAENYIPDTVVTTLSLCDVRPLGLVAGSKIPPSLVTPSQVRRHLASWLPITLRNTQLDVIYSSNHHGRSVSAFYDECRKAKHTVTLLEILETGRVVGMYASQMWRVQNQIYGDGECFLFRLGKGEDEGDGDDDGDDARCFKWDPKLYAAAHANGNDDDYNDALMEEFMISKKNYLAMGGGSDGNCGLRLNEDLTRGESHSVPCFSNEPLAGVSLKEFEVGLVEVYRFVREVDGRGVDGEMEGVWNFPG